MLGILDQTYQLEVKEDIAHWQVLAAETIGCKYKTIAKNLKRDRKIVQMAQKMIIDLVKHIQPIVITLKKNSSNWFKTVSNIEKYLQQVLYD